MIDSSISDNPEAATQENAPVALVSKEQQNDEEKRGP